MRYEFPCSRKTELSAVEALPSVMTDSAKPGGDEEVWEAVMSIFPTAAHLNVFALSVYSVDADKRCAIFVSSKRCKGRIVLSDKAKGGASSIN